MTHVKCPRCQSQVMKQDTANPANFTCSTCGKFVLLPVEPDKKDISTVWDYLIQAGKHLKHLELISEK